MPQPQAVLLLLLSVFVLAASGQCPQGSNSNPIDVTTFASPVVAKPFGGITLVEGDNVFCIPVTAPLSAIYLPFQVYNDPSFPNANASDPTFTATVAKDGSIFVTFSQARFGGGTLTSITYSTPLQTPPANSPPPTLAQEPTIYFVVTITVANLNPAYNYTAFFQPQVQSVDWTQTQNKLFAYTDGLWPGTVLTVPVQPMAESSFKYKITIPSTTGATTVQYCFSATGPGCITLNNTCNTAGLNSLSVQAGQKTIQDTVPLPAYPLPGSNCVANALTLRVLPNARTSNFYPGLTPSFQLFQVEISSTCLTSGALAGIIVGVALGSALLSALVTSLYFRYSAKNGYESLSSPKAV